MFLSLLCTCIIFRWASYEEIFSELWMKQRSNIIWKSSSTLEVLREYWNASFGQGYVYSTWRTIALRSSLGHYSGCRSELMTNGVMGVSAAPVVKWWTTLGVEVAQSSPPRSLYKPFVSLMAVWSHKLTVRRGTNLIDLTGKFPRSVSGDPSHQEIGYGKVSFCSRPLMDSATRADIMKCNIHISDRYVTVVQICTQDQVLQQEISRTIWNNQLAD
jgi:hypothetical protein